MKKKNLRKSFLLALSGGISMAILPLISAACQKGPEIKISAKAQENFKENGYHVKGSASSWNWRNYQIQNPISSEDPLYLIEKKVVTESGDPVWLTNSKGEVNYYKFTVDERGNKIVQKNSEGYPIEASGPEDGIPIQKTVINNKAPENHKYKIIKMFDFLDFESLSSNYDYRVFTFTWDELTTNFPATARDSRYYPYKDNKKALFAILYWNLKQNELAVNWYNEFVVPSIETLQRFRPGVNVPNHPIEEVPWPYFKNIIGKDQFWKNAAEPIVILFENE
ncbi:hypothetical protein AB5V95_02500 [Metamycoplasma spumans]|uniref:hypothetical protein n=1 Tax=Metamycoplasma spumans TaxID=92406 RepID=UPI0034DD6688